MSVVSGLISGDPLTGEELPGPRSVVQYVVYGIYQNHPDFWANLLAPNVTSCFARHHEKLDLFISDVSSKYFCFKYIFSPEQNLFDSDRTGAAQPAQCCQSCNSLVGSSCAQLPLETP
jgi:hypothetical protein